MANADKYLKNYRSFPWGWYCDYPKVGQPHMYICRILSPYAPKETQLMFSSGMTLSELGILGRIYGELPKAIFSYCSELSLVSRLDRVSVAEEVLYFVSKHSEFIKDFNKRLEKYLRQC